MIKINEARSVADVTLTRFEAPTWASMPARGDWFVLEDHLGGPVECPICTAVDRWRMEREESSLLATGFTCCHLVPTDDGNWVRRVARVGRDQVGAFLSLGSLADSAA